MPKYGVDVSVWDSGGFVIEADSLEAARAKLAEMERDEIEEHCSFRKGGYSAEITGEIDDREPADVKANPKVPCEECGEAEATSDGRHGNVCEACLELRIELENEAG